MTVDPNKPVDEAQAELPLETGDKPEGDKPVQPAAPTVDVNAIAEAMIAKLVSAVPAMPATPVNQEKVTTTSLDEMRQVVNAGDRTHPLFASYEVQLAILNRQGQEDEWGALGCGVDHPARALFRANPQAYAGMPRFAYQEWYIQHTAKQQAEEKSKQEKAEKEKEASRAVRESAPGMPSRSVGGSTRSGSLRMTHADFDRRVQSEPDLDDKLDRGLIVFTD